VCGYDREYHPLFYFIRIPIEIRYIMSPGEAYERQLRWRLKQTELGKSNEFYRYYVQNKPKNQRSREDPCTPDPYDARMSKRQFEGRIKAWRNSVKIYTDQKRVERLDLKSSQEAPALFIRRDELHEFILTGARLIVKSNF